jgi:pyruvyltransferase
MKSVRTYWWQHPSGRRNFGDELASLLIPHFCGVDIEWQTPSVADLVTTGSVLDVLPQKGWTGVVAGSGKLHSKTKTDLSQATVLGLRGKLTLADVKLPLDCHPVLGDPGLLVNEITEPRRGFWKLGVVPHWTDCGTGLLFKKFAHLDPHYIDPTMEPERVLHEIGSCEKIVASSLHALIAADAFGIPRRAERFEKMTTPYEGNEWKWHDYSSVLGMPLEFDKPAVMAPRETVESIQAHLFDEFQTLARILR